MPVNWNMAIMPDIGSNALAAFDKGVEQRKAQDGRNAMTAYAQNPNDANLNGLAVSNPQFVIEQKQAQQQAQQKQQESQLIGDALTNPDPAKRQAARQQLAYVNHEEYQKLGTAQKQQVDGVMKTVGQTAFHILQMPEDQQGPALQQALQGLKSQGMDLSGLDLNQPPKQILMSALAMSGQLDQYEQFAQPKYTPVGEGGLAGFQFGQPIQQGGQPQNFGPAAPAGVTFTPIDGGQTGAPSGTFQP